MSLCEAAKQGNLRAVKEFLEDSAQRQSTCADGFGVGAQIDALMAASVVGELAVVRHLVGDGFDPLKADDTGRSAYVWAASGNHIDVVDYFWQKGARPRADDPFIGAVLYSAALWGRKATLEYYRAQSADLDAKHYGYTPLMGAAQAGHLEIVKWLVEQGANTDGALEQARAFRHEPVVNYLQARLTSRSE
jgi:ankyrin repeat protein